MDGSIEWKYEEYNRLDEGPGVARGKINFKEKKFEKKNFEKKNLKKIFSNFFLAYVTPRPPLSVHEKFQPNRSSRLAGFREHIYERLVLLYR